jgi:hypothetical protein
VTLVREWYDNARPEVKFVCTKGELRDVLINGSDHERVSLLAPKAAPAPEQTPTGTNKPSR